MILVSTLGIYTIQNQYTNNISSTTNHINIGRQSRMNTDITWIGNFFIDAQSIGDNRIRIKTGK